MQNLKHYATIARAQYKDANTPCANTDMLSAMQFAVAAIDTAVNADTPKQHIDHLMRAIDAFSQYPHNIHSRKMFALLDSTINSIAYGTRPSYW